MVIGKLRRDRSINLTEARVVTEVKDEKGGLSLADSRFRAFVARLSPTQLHIVGRGRVTGPIHWLTMPYTGVHAKNCTAYLRDGGLFVGRNGKNGKGTVKQYRVGYFVALGLFWALGLGFGIFGTILMQNVGWMT